MSQTNFIGADIEHLTLIRYQEKDPATFKIGDIVEAAVSFVFIPNRGGGHSMHLYLRGVTLLDNSFSK